MLEGEQFVRAAYLTLLGRRLDPDRLASYVRYLRSGRDKRELHADPVLSKEGHWGALDVSGLSAFFDKFGTRKQPLGAAARQVHRNLPILGISDDGAWLWVGARIRILLFSTLLFG